MLFYIASPKPFSKVQGLGGNGNHKNFDSLYMDNIEEKYSTSVHEKYIRKTIIIKINLVENTRKLKYVKHLQKSEKIS